jgi:hypothetical protein
VLPPAGSGASRYSFCNWGNTGSPPANCGVGVGTTAEEVFQGTEQLASAGKISNDSESKNPDRRRYPLVESIRCILVSSLDNVDLVLEPGRCERHQVTEIILVYGPWQPR